MSNSERRRFNDRGLAEERAYHSSLGRRYYSGDVGKDDSEHENYQGKPVVGSDKAPCRYCTNGIRTNSGGPFKCDHCFGSGQLSKNY